MSALGFFIISASLHAYHLGQLALLVQCLDNPHGVHFVAVLVHDAKGCCPVQLVQVGKVSEQFAKMWPYFWQWLQVLGALVSLWVLSCDPRCLIWPSSIMRALAASAEVQRILRLVNCWVGLWLMGFFIHWTCDMELAGRLALVSNSCMLSLLMWKRTGMNHTITGYCLPNTSTGCLKRVLRKWLLFCLNHAMESFEVVLMRILLCWYCVMDWMVDLGGGGELSSSYVASHLLILVLILRVRFSTARKMDLRVSLVSALTLIRV